MFFYMTFNAAYAHTRHLKMLGIKATLSLPQPGTDRYRVRIIEGASS